MDPSPSSEGTQNYEVSDIVSRIWPLGWTLAESVRRSGITDEGRDVMFRTKTPLKSFFDHLENGEVEEEGGGNAGVVGGGGDDVANIINVEEMGDDAGVLMELDGSKINQQGGGDDAASIRNVEDGDDDHHARSEKVEDDDDDDHTNPKEFLEDDVKIDEHGGIGGTQGKEAQDDVMKKQEIKGGTKLGKEVELDDGFSTVKDLERDDKIDRKTEKSGKEIKNPDDVEEDHDGDTNINNKTEHRGEADRKEGEDDGSKDSTTTGSVIKNDDQIQEQVVEVRGGDGAVYDINLRLRDDHIFPLLSRDNVNIGRKGFRRRLIKDDDANLRAKDVERGYYKIDKENQLCGKSSSSKETKNPDDGHVTEEGVPQGHIHDDDANKAEIQHLRETDARQGDQDDGSAKTEVINNNDVDHQSQEQQQVLEGADGQVRGQVLDGGADQVQQQVVQGNAVVVAGDEAAVVDEDLRLADEDAFPKLSRDVKIGRKEFRRLKDEWGQRARP